MLPAQSAVAQVIQLHAPNNASQTVTVWTPAAAAHTASATVATKASNSSVSVVEVHAPNSPTPSATVWRAQPTKIQVALLK